MAFVDHETITGRILIEEIQRYPTVVDAFRREGGLSDLGSEGDPIGGQAEWPRVVPCEPVDRVDWRKT